MLVITKTPLSKVFKQIGKIFSLGKSGISNARARRAERLVDEDFEVSESPPFESPLVKDLVQEFEPQQLDYEVELEDFDEITQEVPKISKPVKSETTRPQQLLLSSDAKYELPPADLLRGGPASKGKSKVNETVVAALKQVFDFALQLAQGTFSLKETSIITASRKNDAMFLGLDYLHSEIGK